jgi:hypothetical protein
LLTHRSAASGSPRIAEATNSCSSSSRSGCFSVA